MKHRDPGTIEDGLQIAAGLLGWQEIADLVGKSVSMCRAWGDPDDDRQLPAYAVVKIDAACKRANGTTPISRAIERQINLTEYRPIVVDAIEAVLSAHVALGNLTQVIVDAKAPKSPGGSRLTAHEKALIASKVTCLDSKLNEVRVLVSEPRGNVHKIGAA